MSSHQILNKSQFRQRKRRLARKHPKNPLVKVKQSLLINHSSQLLFNLQTQIRHLSSYTMPELESFCQQMAIQHMSSSTRSNTICPWICSFCEDFIAEPLTLYCGHTYCEQCIKDDEWSLMGMHCPRCSKDTQGQILSSINHARDNQFSKNHFLKQIFERSETLKSKRENIARYHQAQNHHRNEDYQQAIDIYSDILQNDEDNHLALYGRVKSCLALKQLPEALEDAERVVALKPYWNKGYYCRSEILFEMKRLTAALLSSLQGLALDPEDPFGKQLMARQLHTVLVNAEESEDHPRVLPIASDALQPPTTDPPKKAIDEGANDRKLLVCKSTQSNTCLCALFDNEQFRARDFECSICINLLWIPVTTPCGHVFCRECLIRSIDNTQVQCPMCKSSLDEFFPMVIQSHVDRTELIEQIIKTFFPNEFTERHQLYEQEMIVNESIPKASLNNTEPVTFEIPVFVCVPALPCCACPLHVFEPRYRLMMRRALETQSRTFGMCKYDELTDSFSDYGTLLFIRGLVYTPDGRSIVDTIGQQRFRVIERGMRDGYDIARVQLIKDNPIEQDEFNDVYQLNRETYNRVRAWFDQLDEDLRTRISQQLQGFPTCDDLTQGSVDGPQWSWIILNLLPIETDLQYEALSSRSLRTRLEIINNTMNFLSSHQQTTAEDKDES